MKDLRYRSLTKARRTWISLKNLHPSLRPNLARVRCALTKATTDEGRWTRDKKTRKLFRPSSIVHRPSVDIVLVDDQTIARLSGRFRGKARPTDVLAFKYDEPNIVDEIVISLDTARRQAIERAIPLRHELSLLCVHGLLHLAGYVDENMRAWYAMKRAEFEVMMRIL